MQKQIEQLKKEIEEHEAVEAYMMKTIKEGGSYDDILRAHYRQGKVVDGEWVDEDSDDEEPRTFGAYDIVVESPNDPHVNLHDFLSNNLSKVKEYCDTYGLDYKNIRAYEVDEDPNSDGEYEVTSYDNGIKYKKIKENDILLTEGAAEWIAYVVARVNRSKSFVGFKCCVR